jgi:hypothetical protein
MPFVLNDDFDQLCGPRNLNLGLLDEAVCRSMIALRAELLRSGRIMMTFGTRFADSEERLKMFGDMCCDISARILCESRKRETAARSWWNGS